MGDSKELRARMCYELTSSKDGSRLLSRSFHDDLHIGDTSRRKRVWGSPLSVESEVHAIGNAEVKLPLLHGVGNLLVPQAVNVLFPTTMTIILSLCAAKLALGYTSVNEILVLFKVM